MLPILTPCSLVYILESGENPLCIWTLFVWSWKLFLISSKCLINLLKKWHYHSVHRYKIKYFKTICRILSIVQTKCWNIVRYPLIELSLVDIWKKHDRIDFSSRISQYHLKYKTLQVSVVWWFLRLPIFRPYYVFRQPGENKHIKICKY